MLHTNSQAHQPSGSRVEDFLRFIVTIYGRGSHLCHETRIVLTNVRSPILGSIHMEFEFNKPSGFRGEDV